MPPRLSYVYFPSGPTKHSSLLGVAISLPILCIITTALRFNIRRMQKTSLKIDDWILLPALVLVIGMAISVILGVEHKVWGYLSAVEPTDSSQTFESKLLEAFVYVQICALASIKFSALLFYHRVFQDRSHRNAFDIMKIVLIILVFLWTIAMILMNSLQCGTHISALWGPLEDYIRYCPQMSFAYEEASALSNAILDTLILALPLPKIFGLHTTIGRKCAIAAVFLLATVSLKRGLAASIARAAISFELVANLYTPGIDARLADSLQAFWSMLEAGLSLLAVNLPSIWGYRSHISPDSIIASIRSAISLRSLGSNRTQNSNSRGTQPLPSDHQSLNSSSSKAQFVPRGPGQKSETYAMYDIEAQRDIDAMPLGVIVADSSVLQN